MWKIVNYLYWFWSKSQHIHVYKFYGGKLKCWINKLVDVKMINIPWNAQEQVNYVGYWHGPTTETEKQKAFAFSSVVTTVTTKLRCLFLFQLDLSNVESGIGWNERNFELVYSQP